MGISLDDLKAIEALALHRSFRAAAAEVGASPSALSYTIAAVERRLGIRLFNRTTRSVAPTQAGESFLGQVRPALREIAAAIETVNRFRDTPAGLLRLNASDMGAQRVLPIVIAFQAAYPDMQVDLVTEGRLIDIVAEGFDAGIRLAELVPRDMIALPLGVDERIVIVAAPDYLARRGTPSTPADLAEHDCFLARMPSGRVQAWQLERRGIEAPLDLPRRTLLGNARLAVQAARLGAGLAYANAQLVASDVADGTLVEVLSDWTPPFAGICLYYPRQRLPSAGLRAFIDHFQAARTR